MPLPEIIGSLSIAAGKGLTLARVSNLLSMFPPDVDVHINGALPWHLSGKAMAAPHLHEVSGAEGVIPQSSAADSSMAPPEIPTYDNASGAVAIHEQVKMEPPQSAAPTMEAGPIVPVKDLRGFFPPYTPIGVESGPINEFVNPPHQPPPPGTQVAPSTPIPVQAPLPLEYPSFGHVTGPDAFDYFRGDSYHQFMPDMYTASAPVLPISDKAPELTFGCSQSVLLDIAGDLGELGQELVIDAGAIFEKMTSCMDSARPQALWT
jgi:hypothetical protein